jgi:hypothetical protein
VNWLNEVNLWSAVYRKDRTVFEISDTNMLVEAYVQLYYLISSNQLIYLVGITS